MMRNLLIYIVSLTFLLTSCHNDDKQDDIMSERTVLVYMSGENDLSWNIKEDLDEMLQAKIDDNKDILVVYVDDANKSHMPYVARVKKGILVDSVSISDMGISRGDTCSAASAVMKSIINYAFRKYPSRHSDYGLVLWGHASGWVLEDSIAPRAARQLAPRRGYGFDNGQDNDGRGYWMNMHTMAEVLSQCPHLRFIFADCCLFQCVESAYELRHVADHIIGSPAEIPAMGAPYTTVVPALFEPESFYTSIVDRYYEQTSSGQIRVPLSAIKTSAMDNLATATRTVLQSIKDTLSQTSYPDVAGLIHYYFRPLYHDVNDFILRYAQPEDYTVWKKALDAAVIYKKMADRWVTNVTWTYNYSDFEMTEARYGGISMFVPLDPNKRGGYRQYNEDYRKTAWYHATGMNSLGW
jgi:Clostripain family.